METEIDFYKHFTWLKKVSVFVCLCVCVCVDFPGLCGALFPLMCDRGYFCFCGLDNELMFVYTVCVCACMWVIECVCMCVCVRERVCMCVSSSNEMLVEGI